MMSEDIIYTLQIPTDVTDNIHKLIKIGSTKHIISRMRVYKTGYYKCCLVYYYKINTNCYKVDDMIKKKFNNLRLCNTNKESGTEIYNHNKLTFNVLEKFFTENNIRFEKFCKNDINNEINESLTKKDLKNIYKEDKIYLSNSRKKLKPNQDELHLNITPRGKHQEELYENLDKFKEEKIGQLIWCCGLGKTYMSLMISYKLGCKKILICVPSIYILKQFNKSIKEAFNREPICVYNESENKDELRNLSNDNIVIVLSTYHSCKKVLDKTNEINFKFDIKIGDEAHHLVTSKNDHDKFTFDKFHEINSEYTLFMTATQKEIMNKSKDIYTMSNKKQFGEIIDSRNIDWAIKNKCITNYDIVCIMNSNDEIDIVYESIDFKLICKDNIKCNKKELFFAAYNALKCINDGLVTHLLVYTNRQDTADIIQRIINILLDKNIFENINEDILYNKALHSNLNINLEGEVNNFKDSTFGIISCVYIFGEGFDLPKLNGVVIGEKMTSDIRIVQSFLRPNRIEKDNPNKKAYIIIPTNISSVDDKIKSVLTEMIKEDENVIQKIKFVKSRKGKKIFKELSNKEIKINNCKETLARLKLNLFNNGCFGSSLSLDDEYNYHKELIKTKNFKSIKEYKDEYYSDKIENADAHFYKIWTNWFDYLSIDTSEWITNKNELINYCKKNNIKNTTDYYKVIKEHTCLPPEPEYLYNNFSNLNDELQYRKYIYVNRY